ncbi:MAG TPA: glycosyltransferase family 87 protein, partial [Candidatus Sulfotelmatobacter sp.]
MWFYVDPILVHYQIADAAANNFPRGNLSDLYPRWLGARELLLHGADPYSQQVTVEIQKGYYGRALNPLRPEDPKDQQAFAYPIYIVFLFAPTVRLPFDLVRSWSWWILVGLSLTTVVLWLKVLRLKLSIAGLFICGALLLGSFPAVQGIKLQQLSLLVAGLLAVGAALLAGGQMFLAGAVLALATIKPQLSAPLLAWLFIWTISNWKARWRFAAGFGGTMALLLAASEYVLPGWLGMFWRAIKRYRDYTGSQSILDQLVNWGLGRWGGSIVAAIAVLGCGAVLWRLRGEEAGSENFGRAIALVLALTLLIIPMNSPYNQVLLLPAVLLLAREAGSLTRGSRAVRIMYLLGAFSLAWGWIASMGLTVVWFFSQAAAMDARKLPLFTTFSVPVFVFALALISVRQHAQQHIS